MKTQMLDFLSGGGFVMPPLAVATLVLWFALGWRMITLSYPSVQKMLSMPLTDKNIWFIQTECRRFSVLVKTIVMVAPLTGLLGTVAGMIETFDALAEMALFTQSGGIAGGISQALISTQMGLAVAIPGLVVGRLLDRRAQRVIDQIESTRVRTEVGHA